MPVITAEGKEYIYCADVWCAECIEKIKAELDAEGKTPEDPDDERSYDSDEYPKGPFYELWF